MSNSGGIPGFATRHIVPETLVPPSSAAAAPDLLSPVHAGRRTLKTGVVVEQSDAVDPAGLGAFKESRRRHAAGSEHSQPVAGRGEYPDEDRGAGAAPSCDPCAPLWQPQLHSRLIFTSACVKQFGRPIEVRRPSACSSTRKAVIFRTRSGQAVYNASPTAPREHRCMGAWCTQLSAPSLMARLKQLRQPVSATLSLTANAKRPTSAAARENAHRTHNGVMADSVYVGSAAAMACGMSKEIGCAPLGIYVREEREVRMVAEMLGRSVTPTVMRSGGGGAEDEFVTARPATMLPPMLASPTNMRRAGMLPNGLVVWEPEAPRGASACARGARPARAPLHSVTWHHAPPCPRTQDM